MQLQNNLAGNMTAAFVAPAAGSLRLTVPTAPSIERGQRLPDVTEDIDRAVRGPRLTLGAHEVVPAER
jgi:hypothetical protein